MDAYVAATPDGGGEAGGWRQVGSHAAIRAVHSAHSRRARHGAAAILLLAGVAVVLTTLGPDGGEQLAQLNSAQDTEGLAVQINGIRPATQDVIDSGAWDPKSIEDDMTDGLLPSLKTEEETIVPDQDSVKPLVVDHPYVPPPPGQPNPPPPLAQGADDGSAPPGPSEDAAAPGAAPGKPGEAPGEAGAEPGEAGAVPGEAGAAPGQPGAAPAAKEPAKTKGPWDFEDDADFQVQGHCTMAPTTECTKDEECSASGGGCVYWHCTSDPDLRCASTADCSSSGGICTGPGHCSADPSLKCSQDDQCSSSGGSCVLGGYCSGVPSRSCMSDSDCGDSGGTCRTKNKVWWEADENFPKDPKFGKYPTWSRLQFHKKLLVLMLKILHLQTDMESQVPINGQYMGQITWLKKFLSSSSLEAGDSADQAHVMGKQIVSTLDGELYSDQEKVTNDILGLEGELNSIDAGQDKTLNKMKVDQSSRDKIIDMSEISYVRSTKLWKNVNATDLQWNTTLRPDGQTNELNGMVDRAMGETSRNIGDGIYRYKSLANSRYQTGYRHLYQLYENFKYLTEMHLSKANRHLGKIERTIPKRNMNVMDLVQFVKEDGHLETGTIANATSNVTAIVQAMLSEVEDLITNSVESLADAKAWKKAKEEAAAAAAAVAAAAAAAAAAATAAAAADANTTSVLPVDVIAFTPSKFYCYGTQALVTTCDDCTSGVCASPQAAVRNLDTHNDEMWNPIEHVENTDDISVTLDAKKVKKVGAILWANMGDTTHDPATLKIETADTPEGPWTEVETIDMSSLQGSSKKTALKLEAAVEARYFKLSPGGIQYQSIPRIIALCTTGDCKKGVTPVPPSDSDKIDNLAKAVSEIADFLKSAFPNGAPPLGNGQDSAGQDPGSTVTWEKMFDGECAGPELYMYSGAQDNPGTTDAERTSSCGEACAEKKQGRSDHPAAKGNWDDGFVATGFVVIPATGRCFCESPESETCTRVLNDYRRYDFIASPLPIVAAEATEGSGSGSGSGLGSGLGSGSGSGSGSEGNLKPLTPAGGEGVPSTGNGEEVCENKGYEEAKCLSFGCCHWDPTTDDVGACWSGVGDSACASGASGADDASAAAAPDGPKPSELLLNMYCKQYEDAAARGDTAKMTKYITKCRPQDCEQAKEEVGCHYVNANGFCWVDSGQKWCAENKENLWCLTSVAEPKYELCEGQGETKEWELDTAAAKALKPSSLTSRGRGSAHTTGNTHSVVHSPRTTAKPHIKRTTAKTHASTAHSTNTLQAKQGGKKAAGKHSSANKHDKHAVMTSGAHKKARALESKALLKRASDNALVAANAISKAKSFAEINTDTAKAISSLQEAVAATTVNKVKTGTTKEAKGAKAKGARASSWNSILNFLK